ncbi:MAG: hypothetical protein OEY59_10665, partial [Deltaproteobacteria bacterium]|nr:hypothetical protein [Deltaproteobacteria bacterium]
EDPSLLPCFDIGCGIQMGNILGSERVLAGHLSLAPSGLFNLSVKLVYIFDNSLEFEDSIRFNDKNMDRRFYQLSSRIAENTPLVGKILDANNKVAVISLGERNGVSVGDKLIIYRNKSLERDSEIITSQGTRRKNIGILKITKVGARSSEGVYFQSNETPSPNQYVTTYLDKRKQIQLVEDVRKELDTHERNVYEIKRTIKLAPVKLEDIDKKNWIKYVRLAEDNRNFWQYALMGTGAFAGYSLAQYKDGDDTKLIASFAAVGYSIIHFFNGRNQLNRLLDDGRFKGYIDIKITPDLRESRLEYRVLF